MSATTTAHLTDAVPALPLPQLLRDARQLLDRVSTVVIDEEGVTLQGLVVRQVAWEELERVILVTRFDDLLRLAIGLTLLGRLPLVGGRIQDVVVRTGVTARLPVLSWLRRQSGWVVDRFVTAEPVESKRLPALVMWLYPKVTEAIAETAEAYGIDVVRLGGNAEGR